MIVLSNADVARLLPMVAAIEVVARAMIEVSAGHAELPLRQVMPVGGANRLGVMPGALREPAAFGVKLVSLFPDNPRVGLSSHQGAMVLFEPRHGAAAGLMNAGLLTAIRTAAASAVATRALARPDSAVLAILGAGEQAEHHLEAMLAVRPIRSVRIAARRLDRARAFVERARPRHADIAFEAMTDIRAAVDRADIVCTVTAAREPILFGAWISPGTHLNVVGASTADEAEIDGALVARATLVVDYLPSALAQAGELVAAIRDGLVAETHVRAEIGAVLAGRAMGRSGGGEITLYRSLGIAAQDIACAAHCLAEAERIGLGARVDIT